MNLMIFPIILIYFLIGAFFTKSVDDETYNEAWSITYFLFWPAIAIWLVCLGLSYCIVYVVKKILIIIHNIYRLTKRSLKKKKRVSF